MILIPIPEGFLRGRPPFLRRLAFWALLAGAVVLVLAMSGFDFQNFFADA